MKRWFSETAHKTVITLEGETKKGGPLSAPTYRLERFCNKGKGEMQTEPASLRDLRIKNREFGEQGQLRTPGQPRVKSCTKVCGGSLLKSSAEIRSATIRTGM